MVVVYLLFFLFKFEISQGLELPPPLYTPLQLGGHAMQTDTGKFKKDQRSKRWDLLCPIYICASE